jgi:hypothetical protein
MNIFPAVVAATPSGLVIELLGRQIPVGPRHSAALQGLKWVDVGIRPQALRLLPPGPGRITGRVFLREPLGLEDEVLVETGDGTRVRVVTGAMEEFPEGSAVGLDVSLRDMYVFQSQSKETIFHGIDAV